MLDVLVSFLLAIFQNYILIHIEATGHTLTFWNSNLHEWPRIFEENNTFFAVSVCSAILDLLACFRAHILLSPFHLGS